MKEHKARSEGYVNNMCGIFVIFEMYSDTSFENIPKILSLFLRIS